MFASPAKFKNRYSFPLKISFVMLVMLVFAFLAAFPVRDFQQAPGDNPDAKGIHGFSGAEKHPEGYQYAWAFADASLEYIRVPRYAPLSLHLRLNLERPEGAPPASIQIYESTADPGGDARLLGTLEFKPGDPASLGLHDYYYTVEPRSSGKGVVLEFKSNSFKVQGDARNLSFIFAGADLKVPRSLFFRLFWPNPYWIAVMALLAVIAAWSLRAGLGFLETLLLVGMADLVFVTASASTYQYSWWLLLIAAGLSALYWWGSRSRIDNLKWPLWPLFGSALLLPLVFLFTGDEYRGDIHFYWDWSSLVHGHGLWNIYSLDSNINYLPLMLYLLWIGNFIFYPLGLPARYGQPEAYMAWRIVATLLYLGVLAIMFLINQVREGEKSDSKTFWQANALWLVLIGFNVSLLYNPVVWGQSDVIAILPLLAAFYLIFRGKTWAGGAVLGLVIISKPQAWFILPMLAWMMLKKGGWRKGALGLVVSGVVALALGGIAFGFDPGAVAKYFNSPEFFGNNNGSGQSGFAFNFSFLVVGSYYENLPTWLVITGLIMAAGTIIGVILTTLRGSFTLKHYALGAGLMGLACFTWLVKMKERYLLFGLPFLAIAALRDRRLVKVFLLACWIHLIQLTGSLYDYSRWKRYTLDDFPNAWAVLITQEWFTRLLSLGTIILFFYTGFLYFRQTRIQKGGASQETPGQENLPDPVEAYQPKLSNQTPDL